MVAHHGVTEDTPVMLKRLFQKTGSDGQWLLQLLTVKDFSDVTNHIVNVFKVPVLQSHLLFNWNNPTEAMDSFLGKLTWQLHWIWEQQYLGTHKINAFSKENITTWVLVKISDLRFMKTDDFKQQICKRKETKYAFQPHTV